MSARTVKDDWTLRKWGQQVNPVVPENGSLKGVFVCNLQYLQLFV